MGGGRESTAVMGGSAYARETARPTEGLGMAGSGHRGDAGPALRTQPSRVTGKPLVLCTVHTLTPMFLLYTNVSVWF